MKNLRRVLVAAIACLAFALPAALVAGQKGDKPPKDKDAANRPRLSLKAQPAVVVAPARVVLTAELVGGDDLEEYYCPTIEWEWGDDTVSESTVDCEPYESGKSEIKRRFKVEHVFRRAGAYKVYFHMKRKTKTIASASATVQVQPGGMSQPF